MNYPFSAGRTAGQPDPNEFIIIRLDQALVPRDRDDGKDRDHDDDDDDRDDEREHGDRDDGRDEDRR